MADNTYCQVQVTASNGMSWLVEKRYSDFGALRDSLEDSGIEVTKFPRKHLVRSNVPSVIEERKVELTEFIADFAVANTDHACVRSFLQLDPDSRFTLPAP
eukprot:TRINITY_DN30476_c0_g1_i1.p1 TRINITY_DN30476_c0_g1~~TRINITY_DN30476_c0_g1_i1.p1  ORF type:complete len:101 (+),score=8.57 TRINITY_DN30476_c0_g1_i1:56-358(+)